MEETRLYRIICRKRSTNIQWKGENVVYWMPNRRGYTNNIDEAGLYAAEELHKCAGYGYDWFAERVEY